MKDDLKIVLDFMLDYGGTGSLPNMDEGSSGDRAYLASLRLAEYMRCVFADKELTSKPRILVLPIKTSGASEEQKWFVRGITESEVVEDVIFDVEKKSATVTLKFDRQKYGVAYKKNVYILHLFFTQNKQAT